MPNQQATLDLVFRSLADPTRRGMLARLADGPATVGALAAPLGMALPSVMQHLKVLEAGGLIGSTKTGRVRTVQLRPEALGLAQDWLSDQRGAWDRRLGRLGDLLEATEPPTKGTTP
jgi:DNA-binding transcriptional ArsR family regulator